MKGSIEFDGEVYWYIDWHDPSEDRCSRCRGLIAEDDIPLILWSEDGVRMARLHWEPCAQPIIRQMKRSV
jgi:hypothetical protein